MITNRPDRGHQRQGASEKLDCPLFNELVSVYRRSCNNKIWCRSVKTVLVVVTAVTWTYACQIICQIIIEEKNEGDRESYLVEWNRKFTCLEQGQRTALDRSGSK